MIYIRARTQRAGRWCFFRPNSNLSEEGGISGTQIRRFFWPNPSKCHYFSNLQVKQDLVREIGKFQKSRVKMKS